MKTKQLVLNGMFIALYVVLKVYLSIPPIGNLKITLSGLPIIVCGMLYGPLNGLVVGFIGEFLSQLLSIYGLDATTILWIIPVAFRGFSMGLVSKHYNYNMSFVKTGVAIIITSIIVTALNTIGIYLSSIIYGNYTFATVFGQTLIRFVTGIVTAIIYSLVTPSIVKVLKR